MRPIIVPEDLQNGDRERRAWLRAITAHALAAAQRGNPGRIVKAAWPSDTRAAQIVTRGAVSPTSTGDVWTFAPVAAVYRSLAPASAALALFALGLKLDMTGVSTVHVPSVAGLPVQPVFVAEGQPGPAVQWSFASTVVGPTRKILLLSAVSGELETASPENASSIIGRVLADSATRGIDATAFDAQPADDVRPAGLLHGVMPIAPAAAGADAMTDDLANLIGAIGAAGVDPTDAVIVTGWREATILRAKLSLKFTNLILATAALAPKTVVAVAPAGVASGYSDLPQIETSKEVVIHYEDSTPSDIIGGDGTPAAPSKSAFQSDLIAVRVKARCAWAAAPGAVQVITGIAW